ncbi:MAG: recombinase family protein [Clostridia bacterium]|nr:recombinase family protein [Clostridia bacterium]
MPLKTKLGKCGIYMRLSRDDEKSGESASIENQRIILQSFVKEGCGDLVDEYVDDGWSGTSFDRPAVKRMLDDAQSGRIDTIVVKDLSRFGRNYVQVGQYVDYIFPAYGVRFIALNDNVDTADRGSAAMDMMPIMNVFNEWHAANTSKKIRAVLQASQRSGRYTNWNYPYGYKAGNDENRTAVIDETAAAIVRRIFDLRMQGNSYRAIAKALTDDGIPNPATYYTKIDGSKAEKTCSPYWAPKTVMAILSNPTYTGATVQHKTTSVSYKNHKTVLIPESERIIKEHAHEAIISTEIWEKVQTVNKSSAKGRADKKNEVRPLSGLLVCADCGKKLKFKSAADKSGSYMCRTYIDAGKKYCSSHAVSERLIESTILQDIQSMLSETVIDEQKAKERYIRIMSKRAEQNRYSDERQLKADQNRIAELDKLIQSAFEDKVLKGLPESVFSGLCEKYQAEKEGLQKNIRMLEKRLAEESSDGGAEEYVEKLKRYARCETLTRELCLQLIEFITVGEKEADGGRKIEIYYKFSP